MHFCLTCDRWHFIPRQLSAWNIVYFFLAMSTNPEGPGLSLNTSVSTFLAYSTISVLELGLASHPPRESQAVLSEKRFMFFWNEIMPFAGTGMDLEIIILSEVSQTEKDKYCMISLICGA